jgi:hypothetical protein
MLHFKNAAKLPGTNYIDIFAHPDAFLRRWEVFPDDERAKSPILGEIQLQELGAKIHKASGNTTLPSKESPSRALLSDSAIFLFVVVPSI